MENYYQWHEENVHINVLVNPGASSDEVVGIHDNCLKVRLTAIAEDNAANTHLLAFLADYFGVPKNHVTLIMGDTARKKIVCVKNPKKNRPA